MGTVRTGKSGSRMSPAKAQAVWRARGVGDSRDGMALRGTQEPETVETRRNIRSQRGKGEES